MTRDALGAVRFRAIILSDAAVRDVSREDVAVLLADLRGDVRDAAEFKAAERDAAYDAREGGE